MSDARIAPDDPARDDTADFLERYIAASRAAYPAHGDYVLDTAELGSAGIDFWTVRIDGDIAGCIALKALDRRSGEIKSLCVDERFRGRRLGRSLVQQVIDTARSRGMNELLLETGSMDFYTPARNLYAGMGFEACGAFGDYADDPVSRFMRLEL